MAWIRTTRKWRGYPKSLSAVLYRTWCDMRSRCQRKTACNYKFYGARGITICAEWDDYAAFREWAINNGFRKGLSIDRIDNDGPYSPSNCRWANRYEQAANSSHARRIEFEGRTMPLAAWARELGISPPTLRWRLSVWPKKRALTERPNRHQAEER